MLTYEQMPDTNKDLAKVDISFPFLTPNTVDQCPRDMADIQDYLRIEDADMDKVAKRDLVFIRTAQVAEQRFWIWRYFESDGQECFVTVSQSPDGSNSLGMDWNTHKLSPEQFMLGDYHQVF